MKRRLMILGTIALTATAVLLLWRRGRKQAHPTPPAPAVEGQTTRKRPFTNPEITRVRRTPSKQLELQWRFPAGEEGIIKGFRIMTVDDDFEQTWVSDYLPPATRRWTDPRALHDGEETSYIVVGRGTDGGARVSLEHPVTYYDRPVLPAPTDLSASQTVVSGRALLDLTWQAVPEPTVAGYLISTDQRSAGVQQLEGSASRPIREPRFTLPLESEQARTVRVEVVAIDAVGQEGLPASLQLEAIATSLPAPAEVTVSREVGAPVTLRWSYPGGVAIKGFRLYKNGVLHLNEQRLTTTAREWPDPVLLDGATYRYELAAMSANGILSPRTAAEPFLLSMEGELPAVAPPTGFAAYWIAQDGSAVVQLDWNRPAPGGPAVKGYRLETGPTVKGPFARVSEELIGGRSFRHKPGAYEDGLVYRLIAVDSGDRASEPVYADLPLPADLVATPRLYHYKLVKGGDGVRLEWHWKAAESPFVAGFRFYQDGDLVAGEEKLDPESRSCLSELLNPDMLHRFEIEVVTTPGKKTIRGPAQEYQLIEAPANP